MNENSRTTRKRPVILIAGPTASGKSQLALDCAHSCGGIVINADSMQVYGVLDVLTARPAYEDIGNIPHKLYGFVDPPQSFSVGLWLDHVREVMDNPDYADRPLVFVGGTGLYFSALTGGLAEMPEIPENIREELRQRLAHEGPENLHHELLAKDEMVARRLQIRDGQRIIRALEVLQATGRSLDYWQANKTTALVDEAQAQKIILMPKRDQLAVRIEKRLDWMIENGALDEVRALIALELDGASPAMKAIGVREFSGYLRGNSSLEDATEAAKTETRRYAKRQMTWFRNRMGPQWHVFENGDDALTRLFDNL